MVRAEDMTPEDAQKYLAQQQKKVRERQRAYVKKQLQKGKRRVSVYVTPEAGEFLNDEMERTGKGAAEIVSEALLLLKQASTVPSTVTKSTVPAIRHITTNPDYDQERTEAYIMNLYEQGFSQSAIAKQLNDDGWQTQKTGGQWHHSTVGTIIKRLKMDDG